MRGRRPVWCWRPSHPAGLRRRPGSPPRRGLRAPSFRGAGRWRRERNDCRHGHQVAAFALQFGVHCLVPLSRFIGATPTREAICLRSRAPRSGRCASSARESRSPTPGTERSRSSCFCHAGRQQLADGARSAPRVTSGGQKTGCPNRSLHGWTTGESTPSAALGE